jgi:hypothetical protein
LRTPDPKKLKYYFTHDVTNEETVSLVNKTLRDRRHGDVPGWPGVRVEVPGEEALALIGMFTSFS